MLPVASPQASTDHHSDNLTVGDSGDLRRIYLSLLPPARIIEICLTFEPHVPLHLKQPVWPIDLNTAIESLKKTRPQTPVSTPKHPSNGDISLPVAEAPSQQVHPSGSNEEAILSLKDVLDSVQASRASSVAPTQVNGSGEPLTVNTENTKQDTNHASPSQSSTVAPPESAPTLTQVSTLSPAPTETQPSQDQNAQPQPSSATSPQPTTQAATPSAPDSAHSTYSPYPYSAYGYPGQAPYYAPPPGYLAPYPGYPPYPGQVGYPPPPAGHHAQLYPPRPVHAAAPHAVTPQAVPTSGEDLPSYEDMLVEALSDMGDLEGSAPKDIFLWMESRYPVQTNFRPSASQALQKAFRRGRFEKRPNGKYRLNPAWEGGATSKRTTRRPQTLAQTVYAQNHSPQPSSPFTHAPLARSASAATPPPQAASALSPSTSQTTPYPGYYGQPYGYPAPAYGAPPSQLQPPTAPTSATATASTTASPAVDSSTVAKEATSQEATDSIGDGSDAWEAAQHILQAINFGSLQASASGSSGNPPPPVAAHAGFDLSALTDGASTEPNHGVLTNEERASLQAQLALLAAQLSEIAELNDDDVEMEPPSAPAPVHHSQLQYPPQPRPHPLPPQPPLQQPPQPQTAVVPGPVMAALIPPPSLKPPQPSQTSLPPPPQPPPPPIVASSSAHMGLFIDINQFPEGNTQTGSAKTIPPATHVQRGNAAQVVEEESDDDDMEMVEVPPMSIMDALRT
ncbi:hypothetical protein BXZ70DRAFT_921716 [Cristinia sonorae]|uniref:Histone H1 n=1 Tax=Cristinia sonorae TaxID=1940300 RepID=A0A8K0UWS0_9AGAR|nr:hypothetical protein BXZ70DRAFT_921716 [Cristinia sonorae]